jgi:DNA-binding NarL/FixJ family response regulator
MLHFAKLSEATSMNTIQAIRVLIVDDESLVRRVLQQILVRHPDIELVGEASTGDEAIAAVGKVHPNIVVMDIRMPKMDGIAAARQIKAQHPDVKIIGLSEYAEGYHAHAMELAGAAGTFRKSAATEELYEIIRRVAKG